MASRKDNIDFIKENYSNHLFQNVSVENLTFDENEIQSRLLELDQPCYVVQDEKKVGVGGQTDKSKQEGANIKVVAHVPVLLGRHLGDPQFKSTYGVEYAYQTGAMANGIASEALVIALGEAGYLSSFGAAGLLPNRIEQAIQRIQDALPNGPYAFNLIHSPNEAALERGAVDLYLKYGVHCVEASAFLRMTLPVVYYRVAGLKAGEGGQVEISNKIIAKISRGEVATQFMEPPPRKYIDMLLKQGSITEEQATLAEQIPMADDITVEADSGGHTDNRPLVSLLPAILALRDEIQKKYNYQTTIRVGAAGGIGTPVSALAAFSMGAAYVVTGSVNQACLEAEASEHTKKLLAQADIADVMMAPASDMFEMGVELQVLKRGTMFPMRAGQLYDFYKNYNSIDEIPRPEREKLEKQVFRKPLETVWEETRAYFQERDPEHLEKMSNNPKRKMALIFRWYLGLSSRWSNGGEKGREMDYQIWCGPSMGAFNAWVKHSYLEAPENRKVVDVAHHIMKGAAYLSRLQFLKAQGVDFPLSYFNYHPQRLDKVV